MKSKLLLIIFAATVFVTGITAPVRADVTFVVDSTADVGDSFPGDGFCATGSGECTLRAAVEETEALVGYDTISLPAGTYALSSELVNFDWLIIIGEDPQTTILDASGFDSSSGSTISVYHDHGVAFPHLTLERIALVNNVNSPKAALWVGHDRTVHLNDVEIYNNVGEEGGGIRCTGDLFVERCTLSNNTANYGGGLMMVSGEANIYNTTFSGNHAILGGGIYCWENTLTSMYNVTITANSADQPGTANQRGGGIFLYDASTLMEMYNSIVAGNTDLSSLGPDIYGLLSSNHNFIGDTTGTTFYSLPEDDINGEDPLLGPLADNGGWTRTHALTPASLACDAGEATMMLPTDQRGVIRPQGIAQDMGAYEFAYPLFADDFESGDISNWSAVSP